MGNKSEKKIKSQGNDIPIMTLLNLVEKRICKIECSEGNGIGFFCNIIMDELNYSLKVLITNRHILNEDDIKPGKKIKFSMNNDEQKYEIEIDKERKVYTSKIYDITIIEMKKKDKIKKDSFFEIDDNIYNPDYNFKNKTIYLLHYPKIEGKYYSQGLIKNIGVDTKYFEIDYLDENDDSSLGGPLINSINNKIIGIHITSKDFNWDISLKEPIIEFKKQIINMNNKIKDIKNYIKKIDNKKEKKKNKLN